MSNKSGVVENSDFRFIRSLSTKHFTYMATRQLSGDTTVNDLGHISRSLDCFTLNFSKTVCDTAKVTILKCNGKKVKTSICRCVSCTRHP